ncbi:hypothetical protein [Radiobacillus sp. PE A8.2]|uniref:hypothetical protein n=1 Tax=Radiobacillus sp. PE A8.2 TaxID=3380349 RepID=UPI00388EDFCF
MRKKIFLGINALILLLLISSAVFGYIHFKQNNKYEKYLSHQLTNEVSTLSSATVLNDYLLEDVLSTEKITKSHLSAMKTNYVNTLEAGNKVLDLANIELNRMYDNNEHNIAYM